MVVNDNKKIKLSNKIYSIYSGFSGDLLFWIAINTIFLTNVKGLSAAEISSLTTISNLATILLYPIIFKIIKKIGNINSIKLGTILLLCSSLLFTFSNAYFLILLGNIIYESSFLFKNMDNVILRKNLKYENRENDYIKIQNKSSFIYSFLTMLIAFISGFLFNFNNYLPMILCILFCVLNIILSNFLYEYKSEDKQIVNNKNKIPITKLIILILLLYAFVYAAIDLGQANGKLFIQYELSSFLDINNVSIVLSFIIAISRIVRVLSNYLSAKYCKSDNKTLLHKIGFALIIAFILIIIGALYSIKFIGICLMSIGFFMFLGMRDLFANYTKTLLLNNCNEQYHEHAITYLTIARKTGKFIISTLITLLLLKFDMIYIMLVLLLISIFNIFIINKIYMLTRGIANEKTNNWNSK